MPPMFSSGFVVDHTLRRALMNSAMKNQFGRRGNAPSGIRPRSRPSTTTNPAAPIIAHVGEIETISASSAATSNFVPAHSR